VKKIAQSGWTLLVAGIFLASVFIVALKLMNPTEVHIYLEGQETVLSHVLRDYTIFDVALVVTAAFTAGLSAMYLMLYDGGRPTAESFFNQKRLNYEKILPTLKEDEQKVFRAVLDSDGIIAQSELSELTGVSKSNVSRALDLLESRGYVERRRRGMGNIIFLK